MQNKNYHNATFFTQCTMKLLIHNSLLLLFGLLLVPRFDLEAANSDDFQFSLIKDGASVAKRPYPELNGVGFYGPVVKESPDPQCCSLSNPHRKSPIGRFSVRVAK